MLKVCVGTDSPYEEQHPPCQLIAELCKVLATIQPLTLKVVAVPFQAIRNDLNSVPSTYPLLRATLRPFRNLRNIQGFELIEGTRGFRDHHNTLPHMANLMLQQKDNMHLQMSADHLSPYIANAVRCSLYLDTSLCVIINFNPGA